jgi:hypothetical protein
MGSPGHAGWQAALDLGFAAADGATRLASSAGMNWRSTFTSAPARTRC